MEVLVVTGGIGSGKSEVCRILHDRFGCGIYDADDRVKHLYDSHPSLLAEIERFFGESMRDSDGRFVPSRLSSRIFTDRASLEHVESLVFPALTDDFRMWAKDYADDPFVVFESATVLEKPQFVNFGDKIVLVDAPVRVRLERACARDGASHEDISARMRNQKLMNSISDGKAVPPADAVIHNDGTLESLELDTLKTIRDLYGNIQTK